MENDSDLPDRRSIRLQSYDYAQNGAYFVTICTHERQCLFGEVLDSEMWLNKYGDIVVTEWQKTAALRTYVELDSFVVMPNHFHGILVILEHEDNRVRVDGGRASGSPLRKESRSPTKGSLGAIIALFKQAVTKRISELRGSSEPLIWQRNYYEHIIRGLDDLQRLRDYINANPGKWFEDRYYRS